MQLTSTAGIQVGDWIRIYALATSPYRRSLLAATNSTRPRAAAQPGFLPLTPALERQMESADKYMEEELTPDEIGSAAQAGTLDAVRRLERWEVVDGCGWRRCGCGQWPVEEEAGR